MRSALEVGGRRARRRPFTTALAALAERQVLGRTVVRRAHVAAWIRVEILLVIALPTSAPSQPSQTHLCVPPLEAILRSDELRHDLRVLEVQLLDLRRDFLGDVELLRRLREDGAAVLCPSQSARKASDARVPRSFPCRFNVVGSCIA